MVELIKKYFCEKKKKIAMKSYMKERWKKNQKSWGSGCFLFDIFIHTQFGPFFSKCVFGLCMDYVIVYIKLKRWFVISIQWWRWWWNFYASSFIFFPSFGKFFFFKSRCFPTNKIVEKGSRTYVLFFLHKCFLKRVSISNHFFFISLVCVGNITVNLFWSKNWWDSCKNLVLG